jgi:hypothetical protein
MRIREAQKNRSYEYGTLIPDMNLDPHSSQRIHCNRTYMYKTKWKGITGNNGKKDHGVMITIIKLPLTYHVCRELNPPDRLLTPAPVIR